MKTTYDVGFRPHTHAELREMSREHMVAVLDSLASGHPGGLSLNDPTFWYEAINRRDQQLLNRRVALLTVWITILTCVYTIATLVMLLVMLRSS